MRWTAKTNPDIPIWLWPLVPFVLASGVLVLLMDAAIVRTMDAMRARFGPSDEWRPWFAWHPIRLPPRQTEVVWFEWVERRVFRYGPGAQIEVQVRLPDSAEVEATA